MQLRVGGMGTPIALDFGAVMAVAAARAADVDLLSEVLPAAEAAILDCLNGEPEEDGLAPAEPASEP